MEITVLQWNVWYEEDIRNIAKFLKAHPADVICLQELTIGYHKQVPDTPAYIAEQLGYTYYHKDLPIEGTDGSKLVFDNGIFSRFPIVDSHFAWINEPKSGGGYADEYRAYVEVELDVGGQKLAVGTTHMSYTHRFEDTPGKAAETDRLLAELRLHNGKFVFTGDLNSTPVSYTIESIGKLLTHTGPDLSEKTWATKPFSYNGFEEDKLNWRLDYVFTTSDIEPVSAKILQTDYSDHLPVLVKLQLPVVE